MSSYNTSEFRSGLKILLDNDPFTIVENEFVKPGKGQAFNRVRIKNLRTGRVIERTFKSGDSVEAADVMDADMQFLYADGQFWHFMNPESYEDIVVQSDLVDPVKDYLTEGQSYNLLFMDDTVGSIELPPSMVMTVVDAPEGVKGDSSTNVFKAATMETGLVVQVPLFIKQGEKITVKTEDNSYLGRA